jgi:hypothetical protein
MSNRTYVCLDCRTSMRAKAAYGLAVDLRCRQCSKSIQELGWERRIPAQSDDKGWKELRRYVTKSNAEWGPRRTKTGMEKLIKLDRQISANEKRPPTERTITKLKQLRRSRKVTAKGYNLV